jgi:thiamine-phosphate pyrophosphorylase
MIVDHTLYGIIGPEHARGRALPDLVRAAAKGGMTLVQYRDKHSDTRSMVAMARALKAALAGTGVPLLINDRVDVALAAEADGVHLGQSDMAPEDARRLLGSHAIIGWTLKTQMHAQALADQPVDYATIGGVFATTSKDNPDPPLGIDGFKQVLPIARQAKPVPIGAIAGITKANAAQVIAAGADGIALISALFMVENPEEVARDLRTIIATARTHA